MSIVRGLLASPESALHRKGRNLGGLSDLGDTVGVVSLPFDDLIVDAREIVPGISACDRAQPQPFRLSQNRCRPWFLAQSPQLHQTHIAFSGAILRGWRTCQRARSYRPG